MRGQQDNSVFGLLTKGSPLLNQKKKKKKEDNREKVKGQNVLKKVKGESRR